MYFLDLLTALKVWPRRDCQPLHPPLRRSNLREAWSWGRDPSCVSTLLMLYADSFPLASNVIIVVANNGGSLSWPSAICQKRSSHIPTWPIDFLSRIHTEVANRFSYRTQLSTRPRSSHPTHPSSLRLPSEHPQVPCLNGFLALYATPVPGAAL